MRRYSIRTVAIVMLVAVTLLSRAEAAQTKDMYGRNVALPDRIVKVVGASPPVTYLLYTLDPGLIGGLNQPPNRKLRQVLGNETANLPIIGGFGGPGRNFNAEVLLAAKPDLVIAWPPHSGHLNPKVRRILDSSGIPYVLLKLDTIDDYPHAYEFLGTLLGREERGNKLAAYFRKELKKLHSDSARIPESKRVSIYFAEGLDGLTTVSSDSVHGEALALAGGRNVYRVKPANRRVKDRILIEQVISLNPEVIIVQDETFFNTIYRDSRWSAVKAVRARQVFLEPDSPFSWMDRPPSFLRLMGAKWLAGILYPRHGSDQLIAETRDFFELFLWKSFSDRDIRTLLNMDRNPAEQNPSGKCRR